MDLYRSGLRFLLLVYIISSYGFISFWFTFITVSVCHLLQRSSCQASDIRDGHFVKSFCTCHHLAQGFVVQRYIETIAVSDGCHIIVIIVAFIMTITSYDFDVTIKYISCLHVSVAQPVSTKVLADALGITRHRQGPLVRPPASTAAVTTNRAAVIKAVTPQQSQRRSTQDRQVTSTVLSVPAPSRPTAVVDPTPNTRQHGQCTRCLRAISLTATGLVRSVMGPFPGFQHFVKRVPHSRP